MKTDIMVHCGNSPKMERVIDFTLALAQKDAELVKQYVREDFTWKTVGMNKGLTFDNLKEDLAKRPTVKDITIANALSHGRSAMCEGTFLFEDGESVHFCHVVNFVNTSKNALIKEAHTYFVN